MYIMLIYTDMVCTDCTVIVMCPCILLVSYCVVYYWMNVCASIVCMCCMSIRISVYTDVVRSIFYITFISLQPTNFPIVCALLALDSWNYCSGEQARQPNIRKIPNLLYTAEPLYIKQK